MRTTTFSWIYFSFFCLCKLLENQNSEWLNAVLMLCIWPHKNHRVWEKVMFPKTISIRRKPISLQVLYLFMLPRKWRLCHYPYLCTICQLSQNTGLHKSPVKGDLGRISPVVWMLNVCLTFSSLLTNKNHFRKMINTEKQTKQLIVSTVLCISSGILDFHSTNRYSWSNFEQKVRLEFLHRSFPT